MTAFEYSFRFLLAVNVVFYHHLWKPVNEADHHLIVAALLSIVFVLRLIRYREKYHR